MLILFLKENHLKIRELKRREQAWILTDDRCMINPYGEFVDAKTLNLLSTINHNEMEYILLGHPIHDKPHPFYVTEDTDLSIFKPDPSDDELSPFYDDKNDDEEILRITSAPIDYHYQQLVYRDMIHNRGKPDFFYLTDDYIPKDTGEWLFVDS